MEDAVFAIYADENTTYILQNDMEVVFSNCKIRQKYFFNGLWITNEKLTRQMSFYQYHYDKVYLIVENQIINNSKYEKLLGVGFFHKLTL